MGGTQNEAPPSAPRLPVWERGLGGEGGGRNPTAVGPRVAELGTWGPPQPGGSALSVACTHPVLTPRCRSRGAEFPPFHPRSGSRPSAQPRCGLRLSVLGRTRTRTRSRGLFGDVRSAFYASDGGPRGVAQKRRKAAKHRGAGGCALHPPSNLAPGVAGMRPLPPDPPVPSYPASVTAPPPRSPTSAPPGPARAAHSPPASLLRHNSRLWSSAPPGVQHSYPAPPAEPGKAPGEDRPAMAGFFYPRQVLVAGKSLKPNCQQDSPVLEQLYLLPPLHPPSTINQTSPCAMHGLSPFTPNYQPRSLCPPPSSPQVAASRKDPPPPSPKLPLGACSPPPEHSRLGEQPWAPCITPVEKEHVLRTSSGQHSCPSSTL